MKNTILVTLLFLALLLTACPAHTEGPIDNGSMEVPSWILGNWYELDYKGDKRPGMYILEKAAKKGQMKCYEVDSAGVKRVAYDPVIMSTVSGKMFLSAYASGTGYYILQLTMVSDKEFHLKEVDEEVNETLLPESSGSAQVKKFLQDNISNEEIYGATTRYVK